MTKQDFEDNEIFKEVASKFNHAEEKKPESIVGSMAEDFANELLKDIAITAIGETGEELGLLDSDKFYDAMEQAEKVDKGLINSEDMIIQEGTFFPASASVEKPNSPNNRTSYKNAVNSVVRENNQSKKSPVQDMSKKQQKLLK